MNRPLKPVDWNPHAKRALLEMPEVVRKEFGHEIYLLQRGETPENASPFEGSQGGDVMKLVELYDTNTYRCVYAAKLNKAIYILHVYMKKSTERKKTPMHVIETVKKRYAEAKRKDAEE